MNIIYIQFISVGGKIPNDLILLPLSKQWKNQGQQINVLKIDMDGFSY